MAQDTKTRINDFDVGDMINSTFCVKIKNSPSPYSTGKDGSWLKVKLSDCTGDLTAMYFGDAPDLSDTDRINDILQEGKVYRFSGTMREYQARKQLVLDVGFVPQEITEYDPLDFLPSMGLDIKKLQGQMFEAIDSIKNEQLKQLLHSIFDDSEFFTKFAQTPAAMVRHHAYVGGLLEHIVEMIRIAKIIAEIFDDIDRDMLITGCILHDIGKIVEYKMQASIQYTDSGRFLGHIAIGQDMIEKKIAEIDGFDPDLKEKVIHMILSHHGKLEYGSSVTPKTLEALALHLIDSMDATLKHALGLLAKNVHEDWVKGNFLSERGDYFFNSLKPK